MTKIRFLPSPSHICSDKQPGQFFVNRRNKSREEGSFSSGYQFRLPASQAISLWRAKGKVLNVGPAVRFINA